MEIRIPEVVAARLVDAVGRAGEREVGGVLMGEHVGDEVFRVVDVTVQDVGTVATFVRFLTGAVTPLKRFFRVTNRQYTRYNYLGEWHSHPLFPLAPSGRDSASMQAIVDDPKVGANFAVLLIVRAEAGRLDGRAFLYTPGGSARPATVVVEGIDG